LKYKGGSAAQSTLIQVYDALLGIEHTGHAKEYLNEMCNYMPKDHLIFLNYVRKNVNIKEIIKLNGDYDLSRKYDECVNQLASFRHAHLGLVHAYIMKFIKEPNVNVHENDNDNENAHGAKGSGGTNPIEFCKHVIKDMKIVKNTQSPMTLLLHVIIIFVGAFIMTVIFGVFLVYWRK